MDALRSLVYVSTATFATTGPALESLLIGARAYNLRHAITGVLLCCDGNFMQCVEGLAAEVGAVWHRIRQSRSHTGIVELLDEPAAYRSFPSWEMACAQTTASELLTFSTARWRREARADGSPASPGLELLRQFWRDARQS